MCCRFVCMRCCHAVLPGLSSAWGVQRGVSQRKINTHVRENHTTWTNAKLGNRFYLPPLFMKNRLAYPLGPTSQRCNSSALQGNGATPTESYNGQEREQRHGQGKASESRGAGKWSAGGEGGVVKRGASMYPPTQPCAHQATAHVDRQFRV
ncbi:hypothetical protein HMPREF0308_2305 [Corynebacterium striatum ATCC 6940]|nr:hypothetical protein HMPREF0308_2305 [Corynebacterium striatum ATCC 6940]